jgi:arsenic resistance protein ArsH
MEELVKYSIVMRPHFNLFGDRFSEREERRAKLEAERDAMKSELAVDKPAVHEQ